MITPGAEIHLNGLAGRYAVRFLIGRFSRRRDCEQPQSRDRCT
jgi:hypothetical protein